MNWWQRAIVAALLAFVVTALLGIVGVVGRSGLGSCFVLFFVLGLVWIVLPAWRMNRTSRRRLQIVFTLLILLLVMIGFIVSYKPRTAQGSTVPNQSNEERIKDQADSEAASQATPPVTEDKTERELSPAEVIAQEQATKLQEIKEWEAAGAKPDGEPGSYTPEMAKQDRIEATNEAKEKIAALTGRKPNTSASTNATTRTSNTPASTVSQDSQSLSDSLPSWRTIAWWALVGFGILLVILILWWIIGMAQKHLPTVSGSPKTVLKWLVIIAGIALVVWLVYPYFEREAERRAANRRARDNVSASSKSQSPRPKVSGRGRRARRTPKSRFPAPDWVNQNSATGSNLSTPEATVTEIAPNKWRIVVPANVKWLDTGIEVSGRVKIKCVSDGGRGWKNHPTSGEAGCKGLGPHPGLLVPTANLAALVASLDDDPGFYVGDGLTFKTDPAILFLSMNDTEKEEDFSDNSGSRIVVVECQPA